MYWELIRGGPADEVIERHIAEVPTRTWYPLYKYLSEAGHLDAKGEIKDPTALPQKILARDKKTRSAVTMHVKHRRRYPFEKLLEKHGAKWVYNNILEIPSYTNDVEGFRAFLAEFPQEGLSNLWGVTQHVKGVVVYDYWSHKVPRSVGT